MSQFILRISELPINIKFNDITINHKHIESYILETAYIRKNLCIATFVISLEEGKYAKADQFSKDMVVSSAIHTIKKSDLDLVSW